MKLQRESTCTKATLAHSCVVSDTVLADISSCSPGMYNEWAVYGTTATSFVMFPEEAASTGFRANWTAVYVRTADTATALSSRR